MICSWNGLRSISSPIWSNKTQFHKYIYLYYNTLALEPYIHKIHIACYFWVASEYIHKIAVLVKTAGNNQSAQFSDIKFTMPVFI